MTVTIFFEADKKFQKITYFQFQITENSGFYNMDLNYRKWFKHSENNNIFLENTLFLQNYVIIKILEN